MSTIKWQPWQSAFLDTPRQQHLFACKILVGVQIIRFPRCVTVILESLLITISRNKCQMRVLIRTKMRYCSIVYTFYGSSQHQFFIFDFVFCTRYPCYSDFCWRALARRRIKRNNNTKLCGMKDRRLRSWLVYDYNITLNPFESFAVWE